MKHAAPPYTWSEKKQKSNENATHLEVEDLFAFGGHAVHRGPGALAERALQLPASPARLVELSNLAHPFQWLFVHLAVVSRERRVERGKRGEKAVGTSDLSGKSFLFKARMTYTGIWTAVVALAGDDGLPLRTAFQIGVAALRFRN